MNYKLALVATLFVIIPNLAQAQDDTPAEQRIAALDRLEQAHHSLSEAPKERARAKANASIMQEYNAVEEGLLELDDQRTAIYFSVKKDINKILEGELTQESRKIALSRAHDAVEGLASLEKKEVELEKSRAELAKKLQPEPEPLDEPSVRPVRVLNEAQEAAAKALLEKLEIVMP